MFGIAVGAIIPFTSCWMILKNKTKKHKAVIQTWRQKAHDSKCQHVLWCVWFSEDGVLTPLMWELPHASLLVVLNRDDFSVAWRYIVAVMHFPFPVCFQLHGCPQYPFRPQSRSGRRRPLGRTDHSRRGMWKSAGPESERRNMRTAQVKQWQQQQQWE